MLETESGQSPATQCNIYYWDDDYEDDDDDDDFLNISIISS